MTLDSDEVHVWRTSLQADEGKLDACLKLLSCDERERADRFHFRRHRDAYVAGHGWLRVILGRYLKVEPAVIVFQFNRHGKPSIQNPDTSIRFNFSDSGELALLAITDVREVGVDIERVRKEIEIRAISQRYFTETEAERLLSLPNQDQSRYFFRYWTRKEAVLKAIGRGLSLSLGSFEVHRPPRQPCPLRWTGQPVDRRQWYWQDLEVPDGYAGALTVEGDGWRVRYQE